MILPSKAPEENENEFFKMRNKIFKPKTTVNAVSQNFGILNNNSQRGGSSQKGNCVYKLSGSGVCLQSLPKKKLPLHFPQRHTSKENCIILISTT